MLIRFSNFAEGYRLTQHLEETHTPHNRFGIHHWTIIPHNEVNEALKFVRHLKHAKRIIQSRKDELVATIADTVGHRRFAKAAQTVGEPITSFKGHKLSKHYNYDEDQKRAINHYTADGSLSINQSVMNNKFYNDHHSKQEDVMHSVKHLSKAIHANKTPHDMTVHTGLGQGRTADLKKHLEENPNKHVQVKLPAFTSTSLSKHTARAFARNHSGYHEPSVSLKIRVPKDAKSAYVAKHSLTDREEGASEHEVILHPRAVLRIHPKPSKTWDSMSRKPHHTYHADLIHDGFKPTKYHKP